MSLRKHSCDLLNLTHDSFLAIIFFHMSFRTLSKSTLSRFVSLISLLLCLCSCQDRIDRICSHFGVNLQRTHYDVVEKTDKWHPNGDSELFVRLSFPSAHEDELNDILSQMKNSGAIEMPMLSQHSKLMSGKSVQYIRGLDTGLYLIDVDKNDSRNYNLIVFNEPKKELVIQTIVY